MNWNFIEFLINSHFFFYFCIVFVYLQYNNRSISSTLAGYQDDRILEMLVMRKVIQVCKDQILKDQQPMRRACDSTVCVAAKVATLDEREFRFCYFKRNIFQHPKKEKRIYQQKSTKSFRIKAFCFVSRFKLLHHTLHWIKQKPAEKLRKLFPRINQCINIL